MDIEVWIVWLRETGLECGLCSTELFCARRRDEEGVEERFVPLPL